MRTRGPHTQAIVQIPRLHFTGQGWWGSGHRLWISEALEEKCSVTRSMARALVRA